MIAWEKACKDPELMIKHKDDLKDVEIFGDPWYRVFEKYPYLYREFSDRFDEMFGWDIYHALMNDPTLISDLKDYLHKMDGADVGWVVRDDPTLILDLKDYLHKMERWDVVGVLEIHPELSLCIKYRDYPDKAEAAYYVLFPHELDNLNKKEKREMGKRIIDILREEKI